MRSRGSRFVTVALFGLLTAACGVDEVLAPAPRSDESTSSTAASSSSGGGTPLRTVFTRSPWGGPAENLLVDGDFELSLPSEFHGDANAWYAFIYPGGGEQLLRGETGGLCRTGLRCAVLQPKLVLYGRGTAPPPGVPVMAEVSVKPPQGKGCEVASVAMLDCERSNFALTLKPLGDAPDETGWCVYAGGLPKVSSKRCLYIESNLATGETALVDSATILAVAASSSGSLGEPVLSPATDTMRFAIERARAIMPFGEPRRLAPPSTP